MNAGLFLFLISLFLMLVSSIIITIIIRFRKNKAEAIIREKFAEQPEEYIVSKKSQSNNSKSVETKEEVAGSSHTETTDQKLNPDALINTINEHVEQNLTYRVIMKLSISIVIMAVGLFIVLSNKFGEDEKKWAYGSIGTIIGYWFK